MEFKLISEAIRSYAIIAGNFMMQKGALLILLLFFGSLLVYSYGLKKSWQQMRRESKLIAEDDEEIPNRRMKCAFTNKYIFKNYCNRLYLIAFVLSFIILLFYYLENPGFSTKNTINVISILTYCAVTYGVFIDIPANTRMEKGKSKVVETFYNIIAIVKEITLKDIVTKEKNHYKRYIKDKIMLWVTAWNQDEKNVVLGTLILQIKEDYLLKLLPTDCSSAVRDKLRDLKQEVVHKYIHKEANIQNELNNFFTNEAVTCGLTYAHILEFLNNVELSSKGKDAAYIDERLKSEEAVESKNDVPNVSLNKEQFIKVLAKANHEFEESLNNNGNELKTNNEG